MKCASPYLYAALAAITFAGASWAGDLDGPASVATTCRTGSDGASTCVRISGYLSVGGAYPGIGGAERFSLQPRPPMFAPMRLNGEAQPQTDLGPVRFYVEGGTVSNR